MHVQCKTSDSAVDPGSRLEQGLPALAACQTHAREAGTWADCPGVSPASLACSLTECGQTFVIGKVRAITVSNLILLWRQLRDFGRGKHLEPFLATLHSARVNANRDPCPPSRPVNTFHIAGEKMDPLAPCRAPLTLSRVSSARFSLER